MKRQTAMFTVVAMMIGLGLLIPAVWAEQPDDTCDGYLTRRLAIDGYGEVLPGSPNSLNTKPASSGERFGVIPVGEAFRVVDGPTCRDDIVWWQVDYLGAVGWTGEGQGDQYWVGPTTPPDQNGEPAIPVPPGQLLFGAPSEDEPRPSLWVVNTDGSGLRQLTHGPLYYQRSSWSPDATRIVALGSEDSSGLTQVENRTGLYVLSADGANFSYLTQGGEPAWSPDGTRVVFSVQRHGIHPDDPPNLTIHDDDELYVVNSDGSNLTRLTNDPGSDTDGAWSPDGGRIAFRSSTPDVSAIRIMVINVDGSNRTILKSSSQSVSTPVFSPDGDQLLYTMQNEESPFDRQVYLMNADGSNDRLLLDWPNAGRPVWSPDGEWIAFVDMGLDWTGPVWIVNVASPEIRQRVAEDAERTVSWRAITQEALQNDAMSDAQCPDGYLVSRLTAGGVARVLSGDPNGLNTQPISSSVDPSMRTGVTIPSEASFNVINGPFCGLNGMVWWKVEYEGTTGWTPEGIEDAYWVEPLGDESPVVVDSPPTPQSNQCPGVPTPRLTVGGRARVLPGEPNNLRAEATTSSEKIGQIPGGAEFAVLEGPVCADDLAYWRVEYNGLIGWTAEGSGDTYWTEPIQ